MYSKIEQTNKERTVFRTIEGKITKITVKYAWLSHRAKGIRQKNNNPTPIITSFCFSSVLSNAYPQINRPKQRQQARFIPPTESQLHYTTYSNRDK